MYVENRMSPKDFVQVSMYVLEKSTVNEDEHTIYLRKGLSEESREAELFKLYVKMRVKKAEVTVFEEELCDYLQIVMKRYFCCISEQDGKCDIVNCL